MADNFRKLIKNRLLEEMLGAVKFEGSGQWSVLVLDAMTTRVMSHACRISEILDYGVSLTEDLNKGRERMTQLSGVYFISPTDASIERLIQDFHESHRPLYKAAHVFFSSRVAPSQLQAIKNCSGLVAHLKTLKEVNLEILTIDKRTFITDDEHALAGLFGETATGSASYKAQIDTIANRLMTVFASLKEFPVIRFRAAKPGDEAVRGMEARALIPQRIAVELSERLLVMQRAGQLPAAEDCELIIADRGFDPVAPAIHEFTYEAMAYDNIEIEDNIFKFESETQGGKIEQKEHLLQESDDFWVELRHEHFAAATKRITEKLDVFRAKNQAAAYNREGGGAGAMDTRNMRNLVRSLPQYREQLAQLAVHVEIASTLTRAIEDKNLTELGKLEQDLVFGDATSKEVISFFSAQGNTLPPSDKMRLLLCYCATHPEKMDAQKQVQWQKLARLQPQDMNTLINLEYLGVPVRKRGKSTGLTFGRKRKRAVRKDREAGEDENQYALSRFVPLLHEVIEDLCTSKLSTDEYPYVRAPAAPDTGGGAGGGSARVGSVRTARAAGWAAKKAGTGGVGPEAELGKPKGKRVVFFVIGGISRSEMRTAHKLSAKYGRDIILGGTCVETPKSYLKHLSELSSGNGDQIALEIE